MYEERRCMGHRDFQGVMFCSCRPGAARSGDLHPVLCPASFHFVKDAFSVAEFFLSLAVEEMVEGGVPEAYKDVSEVVDAADVARLARKVARLEPIMCVKGLGEERPGFHTMIP
ncbi:MAG: RtcB family protein [Nitrospira sp.]